MPMLTTIAQKLAIPLSLLLTMTNASTAKIKMIAADAKRAPVYEIQLQAAPAKLGLGDLSKTLTGFTGAVTSLATDGTTLLAASSNGSVNLIHPTGWSEDLTGMLSIAQNEKARINAAIWNRDAGYWLVGGTILDAQGKPSKPLLVKLVPNGLQTENLRLDAQKWKLREVIDIACRGTVCLITGTPGKVLSYDGGALNDISAQFGFVQELAPRIATNKLVWMIMGVARDSIDNRFVANIFLYDGSRARLVSGDHGFAMRSLPAMGISADATGSKWLAMAHDGMLHGWVLDGTEFTPIKNFPKDHFVMPTIASFGEGWMLGGGTASKNAWKIDAMGAMTTLTYPDMFVQTILSTDTDTFIGGSTSLTTSGGATPTLIRVK